MAECDWPGCSEEAEPGAYAVPGLDHTLAFCRQHENEWDRRVEQNAGVHELYDLLRGDR